jgi:hypothetical protein
MDEGAIQDSARESLDFLVVRKDGADDCDVRWNLVRGS